MAEPTEAEPDIAAPLFDGPEGPDPRVGTDVAGRYRLTSRILRGRSGSLYRTEFAPGRPAVIRMFEPNKLPIEREEDKARFDAIAGLLRRLVHPNTARVLDHGVTQGSAYLTTEYVHGTTLGAAMGNEALEPERAIHIAQQILGALQEAHVRGVIHRDLKPGNVMLTRMAGQWNHVKLVEWWLLPDWDDAVERTGDVDRSARTPMYLSPEQIRGETLDGRADIYVLGVLLYRMLTGTTPFRDGKPPEVLMAHLNDEPRFFSEAAPELVVPPSLEWTVFRCLEKDANDRFANVAEVSKALAASLIALEDPTRWRLGLQLQEGRTQVPEDLQDATASTSLSAIEEMLANAPELARKLEPSATLDTASNTPHQVPRQEVERASGGSLKYALVGAALMIPLALVAVMLTVIGIGFVGAASSPGAAPAAPVATPAPTVAAPPPTVAAPPPTVAATPIVPPAEVTAADPEVADAPPAASEAPAEPRKVRPAKVTSPAPAPKVAATPVVAATTTTPPKAAPAKEVDPFGAAPKSDLKDPFGN